MKRLAFAVLMLCAAHAGARNDDPLPTHCRAGEHALVDAWFGPLDYEAAGIERYPEGGKLLSLCADRREEPFSKIAYRYGKLGKPEMEAIATPASRAGIFNRQTTPHTGEDIVFFKNGPYTYYVVIAGGQAHGVTLLAFKGEKKLTRRFSGLAQGIAYQTGPAELRIWERRSLSPATTWMQPPHRF